MECTYQSMVQTVLTGLWTWPSLSFPRIPINQKWTSSAAIVATEDYTTGPCGRGHLALGPSHYYTGACDYTTPDSLSHAPGARLTTSMRAVDSCPACSPQCGHAHQVFDVWVADSGNIQQDHGNPRAMSSLLLSVYCTLLTWECKTPSCRDWQNESEHTNQGTNHICLQFQGNHNKQHKAVPSQGSSCRIWNWQRPLCFGRTDIFSTSRIRKTLYMSWSGLLSHSIRRLCTSWWI